MSIFSRFTKAKGKPEEKATTLPKEVLEQFKPHKQEKAWPKKPQAQAFPVKVKTPRGVVQKYEDKVLSPKKVLMPNGMKFWSYWYEHPWLLPSGRIREKEKEFVD